MNKYRYIVVEDEELICQNIIRKIEGLRSSSSVLRRSGGRRKSIGFN